MLHTKVHGNRSTGFKEKLFKVFYNIWTRKSSVHVAIIIFTYFHLLVPKIHKKNGQKGQMVSEKNKLKILIRK